MSEAAPTPILIDIREAGRLLCCSRSLIYTLVGEGRLKPIKLGKSTRFRRSDILRLAEGVEPSSRAGQ